MFEEERVSIMITIPGYTNEKQTIADLKLKEGKVQLSLKIENLETVYISSKKAEYSCKRIVPSKRKNYTRSINSGTAYVSYYNHSKYGNCNLNSVLFYFDNSSLITNKKIYIRPLIYEVQNENMIPLIETPYAILLNPSQDNVLINLTNAEIRFEDNKEYLIGFEVINRDDSEKIISFRLANHRNNYTLFRANPTVPWYDFRVDGGRFSLDYEIYFDHCN